MSATSLDNVTITFLFFQNFGLDKEGFYQLIKDCPLSFYHLATECCQMDPDKR